MSYMDVAAEVFVFLICATAGSAVFQLSGSAIAGVVAAMVVGAAIGAFRAGLW